MESTQLALRTIVTVLVLTAATQAAMTLDQQNLTETGWITFFSDQPMAQTFTPGISGTLQQVDIKGGPSGGTPATVSIETVTAGIPSGTTLGAVPIAHWAPQAWNLADFQGEGISLTAGVTYAIVLSSDSEQQNSVPVNWGPDTYPGGQNLSPWEGWAPYAKDIVFRTWMDCEPPTTIPAPGAIGLVALGASVLGFRNRRTR